MALATVLLYIAVTFMRPGEILRGWEGFPFAAIFGALATGGVLLSLLLRPRRFWNQPHDRYVLGFLAAALVSNATWGWFGGGIVALKILAPTVLCYFLIRAVVRTPSDLRWIGATLVAAVVFQAANGINQYWRGTGLGDVEALEAHDVDYEPPPEPWHDPELDAPDAPDPPPLLQPDYRTTIRRIRGTGIFNDPNDLGMAFVVVLPFLLGPIFAGRTRLATRALALLLAVPIVVALFYTNSRGAMLALGAVLVSYCWRWGKIIGIFMAVVGLTAIIALGP